MARSPTLFLQFVILLAGAGAMALMLWEPQIEGRNVHATQFEIYFQDPFLAFAYIASTPFFAALYQVFRLLEYAGRGTIFSQRAVTRLRTIKYCGAAMTGFAAVGEVFIFLAPSDDRAGGVFMGLLIAFGAAVMASAAAMLERLLRKAVEMKSENDRLRIASGPML